MIGNLLIYPSDEEARKIILTSESFFSNNIKKDLNRERHAVILTNISYKEIKEEKRIREDLKKMGIYDFEKVSEKFDEERMIVKAICINIESRDNFLKCSLENKTISLTLDEDSFQIYIEANIQPIIQCSKCGQYNHHKNDCPQNNTQICANCGG